MDPSLPIAVFSSAAALSALVGGSGLGSLLLWLLLRKQKEISEEEKRNREIADRIMFENLRHREREREERQRQEAEVARQRLEAIVAHLVASVRFADQKVYVGTVVTGQRAIGMSVEESPGPADDIEFRGISSPAEMGSLLPSELAFGQQAMRRIATGEAQVISHVAHVPVLEDIHEPVWETRKNVLYVLIDVSPSMYQDQHGGKWKRPIYWNILFGLAKKAIAGGAVFVLRPFDGDVKHPVYRIENQVELARFLEKPNLPAGSNTNIQLAIEQAISDLVAETFDRADILIITDGDAEDSFDEKKVRARLDETKIGLHSILVGINNDKLRRASDLAQCVLGDFTLGPETRR